ncbi:MAG TPA: hypothetical protein VNK49_08410 [Anaerolineales bacterium]|nr:hypothetical protein [Anaerolineales bacterium]
MDQRFSTNGMRRFAQALFVLWFAIISCNLLLPSSPVVNLSQSSVSDLVTLLTSEKTPLAETFQTTQEILARGGIAVGDMQNTFVRPYSPASSLVLTPREVLQLAEEARSGPSVWRMDMAELGQMLSDLGWPSEPDGKTVGEQLTTLLFAWHAEAAKNPQDPENSTPLFLMAMAKYRAPDVDFSSGVAAPEKIRLGMLEVVLFIAAFDRLIPPQSASNPSSLHLASLLPNSEGAFVAQISPCKPFQDSLFGRLAYEGVGGFLLQTASGKAFEKGLEVAGISEWGQDKIGKAMFAVGMFSRVMRAVLLATYVNVRLSIEGDNAVHKPLEGEQLLKAFHAQAGIPPQDWQAYQEQFGKSFHGAMRECLSWLGVSTYTLDDLKSEMDKWAIEWRLVAGSPEHAHWSPDQQIVPGQAHQGYWRTPLIRSGVGDVVGKSSFVVEIRNEKEKDHPGILLEAPVRACAYLDVARLPTFSTFAQAAAGGLAGAADSVVELLQGMMEKLAKPKACTDPNLKVTYHKPIFVQVKILSKLENTTGGIYWYEEERGETLVPLTSSQDGSFVGSAPIEMTLTVVQRAVGTAGGCDSSGAWTAIVTAEGSINSQSREVTLQLTLSNVKGTIRNVCRGIDGTILSTEERPVTDNGNTMLLPFDQRIPLTFGLSHTFPGPREITVTLVEETNP